MHDLLSWRGTGPADDAPVPDSVLLKRRRPCTPSPQRARKPSVPPARFDDVKPVSDAEQFRTLMGVLEPYTFNSPPRTRAAPASSPPKDIAVKRAEEVQRGRAALHRWAATERMAAKARQPSPKLGTP